MYTIVSYDIRDAKRSNKVRKVLGRYLFRIQLSVWEGELTFLQIEQIKSLLKEISAEEDSIQIWVIQDPSRIKRISIGKLSRLPLQKAFFF